MARVADIIRRARESPAAVRFRDLVKVCDAYFGPPRQAGTSHRVYRTPWPGDPRVNIQDADGMAKAYQVRQVLRAIEKVEAAVMTDHYTYRVTWSPDDGEHVGLCAEFPSLSWLAATAEEAFSGIRGLVREVLSDMHVNGETPPAPLADRAYSGKFLVRVPPETHRALVLRAAEEGVSLNRLVSARLAD